MFAHSCAATADFLEQAGCRVDRIVLAEHSVHGNGHLMMLERNSRDALEPMLNWLDDTVDRGGPRTGLDPLHPLLGGLTQWSPEGPKCMAATGMGPGRIRISDPRIRSPFGLDAT